jgi:hypothetical protein
MPYNITLFNRTNNIMSPNIDVAQSKLLIDLFLGVLLKEERKFDPRIFQSNPENKF